MIKKLELQKTIFGNPKRIVADKGAAFTSKEFESYCTTENIELHLTTTSTPRGNGQAERINAIVKQTIMKMAINNPNQWYKYVETVQLAINTVVTRGTGFTPGELLVGVKLRKKLDDDLMKVLDEEITNVFVNQRATNRAMAVIHIQKLQVENGTQYNKTRKSPNLYVVGDLVAIETVQRRKGANSCHKWLGPMKSPK